MTMPKPIAFALLLAVFTPASAHVTVWPKDSVQGAREKYEIRVPNEKQADTIRVEVRFPAGLKVTSFEQKPGWNTEPLRDGSGAIVGARWTGRLPPMQFTGFGLLAVNPPRAGQIEWTSVQLYADGTRVEWSGPAGSKTPAPRVTLRPR
jgi:hypothetical protein